MREQIQKWYNWLKQAASSDKQELAHVYSDGHQLWATDGHSLYARHVATGQEGRVTLDEDGLFQVSANGRLPDFSDSLPQSQPVASFVVDRDRFLQALAGQDQHIRLTFFAPDQAVELSSAGAYALVMPLAGLEEEDFWRPEIADT